MISYNTSEIISYKIILFQIMALLFDIINLISNHASMIWYNKSWFQITRLWFEITTCWLKSLLRDFKPVVEYLISGGWWFDFNFKPRKALFQIKNYYFISAKPWFNLTSNLGAYMWLGTWVASAGKFAKMSSPPDELSRSVSMAVERAVDQALSAIVPTPSAGYNTRGMYLCTDAW